MTEQDLAKFRTEVQSCFGFAGKYFTDGGVDDKGRNVLDHDVVAGSTCGCGHHRHVEDADGNVWPLGS